jgi:hypothetical protein
MIIVPTLEAMAGVLIYEDEDAFGKVAGIIVGVGEAGQHGIRQNLHGEMNYPIKDISKAAVNATRRLNDSALLRHVSNQPVDVESLGAPKDPHPRERIGR